MAGWVDALTDETGLRPRSVTCAALLGVLTGGVTLVASVIGIGLLLAPAGTFLALLLAWLVMLTQVTAAVLLIVGGGQLMIGISRTTLIVGAALDLLVCAVYLLYALTVLAHDPTEPPHTTTVFATISLVFAVAPTLSLILAMLPITTEYLRYRGPTYSVSS